MSAITVGALQTMNTGWYLGPGGWVYLWNAGQARLFVVYNPVRDVWAKQEIANGTEAWAKVVNEIIDAGRPLSEADVKTLKAGGTLPPVPEDWTWSGLVDEVYSAWDDTVSTALDLFDTVDEDPDALQADVQVYMESMQASRENLDRAARGIKGVQDPQGRLELERQWSELDRAWYATHGGFVAGMEEGDFPDDPNEAVAFAEDAEEAEASEYLYESDAESGESQMRTDGIGAVSGAVVAVVVLGVAVTVAACAWASVNRPYAEGFRNRTDALVEATQFWVDMGRQGKTVPTPREALGEQGAAPSPNGPDAPGEDWAPWVVGGVLALVAGAAIVVWGEAGGKELAGASKSAARRLATA